MSSKTPIILIPTPIQHGKLRYSMSKNYVHSLIAAGAAPFLMPVALGNDAIRHFYEMCDGILLAGGSDCDPQLFGEPKHDKTAGIDDDRDRAEILLTQWAVADDKAVFGICRGMQMMNVAMGGTLIQDIPSQWPTNLVHSAYAINPDPPRDGVSHAAQFAAGSRIAQIIGVPEAGVNSFHHQSVKRMADGFVPTSTSPDGIIESFEMPNKRFSLGVQWHPEDMAAGRDDMMNLFRAFVDFAR